MSQILERGDIYFFYRSRVQSTSNPELLRAHSIDDVQRFFFIMSPHGQDLYRLAIVGRKRMPDLTGERNWGFVEEVASNPTQLRDRLGAHQYETKTRGERAESRARPAGEGVYAIIAHDRHVHLVYSLELPKHQGEVQEQLEIRPEASYVMAIKNPETTSPPGAGLDETRQADLSRRQQQKFHGRRFIAADPQLLDQKGTEFVLIGADEDVPGELGITLKPEDESLDSADIFKDLKLDRARFPTKPLTKGEWQ